MAARSVISRTTPLWIARSGCSTSCPRDYDLFRESVRVLRELGFRIAIDDAGSGYASLQSIAELRPNYLKISNYLVTGLHEDSIKRDVVEMLVRLAARIDAETVAEGIETEAENCLL